MPFGSGSYGLYLETDSYFGGGSPGYKGAGSMWFK
ncbi:UNVERIFIED_ORG: hypothetical protein ABIB13_002228 [Arthrobacter sp. UYEF2]